MSGGEVSLYIESATFLAVSLLAGRLFSGMQRGGYGMRGGPGGGRGGGRGVHPRVYGAGGGGEYRHAGVAGAHP